MLKKKGMIRKLSAITSASILELRVTKSGGPVSTAVEVASTGSDDRGFSDRQLTPGPATMPLNPASSYTIGWTGAFMMTGTATLTVRVLHADGALKERQSVRVVGKRGEVFFRLVLMP